MRPPPAARLVAPGVAALIMLVAAFAIRCWQFGNPLIQVDENFYLLVGDRMWSGALPYVDIWDRKPIGLFLIYAAIRLLGGDGILQYQIVATLFVAATGFVVAGMARRVAPPGAALVSGVFYMLILAAADGTGGQAPIFYNLPVALAAWAVLRLWTDPAPSAGDVRRLGVAAMALVGVAMQIKYTALFEGVFFGVTLMWLSWRADRSLATLVVSALLWVAAALLPTALAWGYYIAVGQGEAWLYANILSIGQRTEEGVGEPLKRLSKTWIALHLPLFCVLLSILLRPVPEAARAFRFVLMWLGAALAGFLAFGTYFDHYALPLMTPIAAACAPLFGHRDRRIGTIASTVMLLLGAAAYLGLVADNRRRRGGPAAMRQMVAAIAPRLAGGGTLFLYDADSILYHFTGAAIPTRFAFPQHLHLLREAPAIGADPLVEIARVLATRPTVVVDALDPSEVNENPASNRLVRGVLARDYRLAADIRQGPRRHVLVYERRRGG